MSPGTMCMLANPPAASAALSAIAVARLMAPLVLLLVLMIALLLPMRSALEDPYAIPVLGVVVTVAGSAVLVASRQLISSCLVVVLVVATVVVMPIANAPAHLTLPIADPVANAILALRVGVPMSALLPLSIVAPDEDYATAPLSVLPVGRAMSFLAELGRAMLLYITLLEMQVVP